MSTYDWDIDLWTSTFHLGSELYVICGPLYIRPDLTEFTGSTRIHAHSPDSAAPWLTLLAGGQPTGFLDDGIRIERLQVGCWGRLVVWVEEEGAGG